MMTTGLQLILLLFALVGFGGAGAALAVARGRAILEGERDYGMCGVAVMLLAFGVLCALVASGLSGVLAFGAVAAWAAYVLAAQRVGLFRIETGWLPEAAAEEPRQAR